MSPFLIAIIAIVSVIVVLFILTFAVYITNADMKLVQKLYNWFIKYHDEKHIDDKL